MYKATVQIQSDSAVTGHDTMSVYHEFPRLGNAETWASTYIQDHADMVIGFQIEMI